MRLSILAALLAFVVTGGHAGAQSGVLKTDDAFTLDVARHDAGVLQLNWDIADGYYLYRDRFSAAIVGQSTALPLALPEGTVKDDPTFGASEIYKHHVGVAIPVPDGAQLKITYQGCKEDSICYPPITKFVDSGSLTVSDASAVGPGHAAPSFGTNDNNPTINLSNATYSDLVTSLLASGGPLWVVLSFWFFGLLLAFTPCMLPMYPILAATLARSGEKLTATRGFALSGVYVFAMASAFSLLGVVTAWSGQNLQIVLQSPVVVSITALSFVILASSMFGIWELQLPSKWINFISATQQGRRGSVLSAGFVGFTSALIVGPCVTAPLAAALLYIAETGNVPLGAASLFALGVGQGVPLMAVGILGSRMLPAPGPWMNNVKYAFGFVFLGAATWLASRVVPASVLMALWAALLVIVGIFIGALDVLNGQATRAQRAAKAMGCLMLLYGAILALGAASGASDPLRPFERFSVAAPASTPESVSFHKVSSLSEFRKQLEAASAEGVSSVALFTAEWCITCKVLERDILSQPAVRQALAPYRAIEVDLTRSDADSQALLRELQVIGPPTVTFFDAAFSEIRGTRLVGEISAQSIIASAHRDRQ